MNIEAEEVYSGTLDLHYRPHFQIAPLDAPLNVRAGVCFDPCVQIASNSRDFFYGRSQIWYAHYPKRFGYLGTAPGPLHRCLDPLRGEARRLNRLAEHRGGDVHALPFLDCEGST